MNARITIVVSALALLLALAAFAVLGPWLIEADPAGLRATLSWLANLLRRSRDARTLERPRLVVFRSLKHIYAQLVNDDTGLVLLGELQFQAGELDAAKANWTKACWTPRSPPKPTGARLR